MTGEILKATIPTGLGDLIIIKGQLEASKHRFSRIELAYNRGIMSWRGPVYPSFLYQFGKLLFDGPPYVLTEEELPHRSSIDLKNIHGLPFVKPNLQTLLCKGNSLNLAQPYIVVTTKIRAMNRDVFNSIAPRFFSALNDLTKTYKIVILGEKVVEGNYEYNHHGQTQIYSIYPDIMAGISNKNAILDLTIPALGFDHTSELTQVMQDCKYLREAHCVITFGEGGNLCMALACANKIIGFQQQVGEICAAIIANNPNTVLITSNRDHFISLLKD